MGGGEEEGLAGYSKQDVVNLSYLNVSFLLFNIKHLQYIFGKVAKLSFERIFGKVAKL